MSDYDEYPEGLDDYGSGSSPEEGSYSGEEYSNDEYEEEEVSYKKGVKLPSSETYEEKLNPSDYNRTGGFASENVGIQREGGRGRYSNIYEIFISQIYINIRDTDDTQINKNYAEGYSRKIPKDRMMLLNIDVLVPTLLFIANYRNKDPSPQEIENYLKKYKNINVFDFIRYYRHVLLLLKL